MTPPKCGELLLPGYNNGIIEREDCEEQVDRTPWRSDDKWQQIDCIINKDERVCVQNFEREMKRDQEKKSIKYELSEKITGLLSSKLADDFLENMLEGAVFSQFNDCYADLIKGKQIQMPLVESLNLTALLDTLDCALRFMNLVSFQKNIELDSRRQSIYVKFGTICIMVGLHVLHLGKLNDVKMVPACDVPGSKPNLSDDQMLYKSLVNKGLQFHALTSHVLNRRCSDSFSKFQYFSALLLVPNLYSYLQQIFQEYEATKIPSPEDQSSSGIVPSNFDGCGADQNIIKRGGNFLLWPLGEQCCVILDRMIDDVRNCHAQKRYDDKDFENPGFCSSDGTLESTHHRLAHIMSTCPIYHLLFLLSSATYCKVSLTGFFWLCHLLKIILFNKLKL